MPEVERGNLETEWLAGTPIYAPPERVTGFESFGRARDVWALGCVLLEILSQIVYGFSENAAVEIFERERLKTSRILETRVFCLTMECVYTWMGKICKRIEETNEQGKDLCSEGNWEERRRNLGKLLETIRHMLELNPLERVESSQVLNLLTGINKSDEDRDTNKGRNRDGMILSRKREQGFQQLEAMSSGMIMSSILEGHMNLGP